MKIVILIPTYNPDELLIKYIKELNLLGLKDIIVVNDGSKNNNIFNNLDKNVKLINHKTNMGKGNAIKTGFKYYLNNYKGYSGIVTADDDGQHLSKDVYKIANILEKNSDIFILGVRKFNVKGVPFKSKYGNVITSYIFKKLYKKYISDTQTGLRGYPNEFINKCVNIEGNNFEYEINVLIESVKNNLNIIEENISTLYFNKNKKTRFKGLSDSIKIYKLLLRNRK